MRTFSILSLSVFMIFISACSVNQTTETKDFEHKTIQLYPKGQETLLGEATISVPSLKKYLHNSKYADEYFQNRYLDIEYYWGKTLLAISSNSLTNSPEDFKPFLMKESYSIISNTDEFISVLINSSSDTPFLNMQKSAVSFSKKTGKIIALDEIFKNKDYKEIIKDSIKQIIRDDTQGLYIPNAQRAVDLIFDQAYYYLTGANLIFIFPVNSVSTEDKGSITFIFPLKDLDKKVGLNK